jgi:hypothetical protein
MNLTYISIYFAPGDSDAGITPRRWYYPYFAGGVSFAGTTPTNRNRDNRGKAVKKVSTVFFYILII